MATTSNTTSILPQLQAQAQQLAQQQYINLIQGANSNQANVAWTTSTQNTVPYTFQGSYETEVEPKLADYKLLIALALVSSYGPEMTKRLIRKFAAQNWMEDDVIDKVAKTLMTTIQEKEDDDADLEKVINDCAKEIKL